jgi:hypothetical protein
MASAGGGLARAAVRGLADRGGSRHCSLSTLGVQPLTCTERRPAAGALPVVVAAVAAGLPNAALLLLPIALRLPATTGTGRAAAWWLQVGPAAETVCMLLGGRCRQAGSRVIWCGATPEFGQASSRPLSFADFALERPSWKGQGALCETSRLHHSCPSQSLADRTHCLESSSDTQHPLPTT